MELFENDAVNISRIYSVVKYDFRETHRPGAIKMYNVNLRAYELIFFLEGEGVTEFAGVVINDRENSVRYLMCTIFPPFLRELQACLPQNMIRKAVCSELFLVRACALFLIQAIRACNAFAELYN